MVREHQGSGNLPLLGLSMVPWTVWHGHGQYSGGMESQTLPLTLGDWCTEHLLSSPQSKHEAWKGLEGHPMAETHEKCKSVF